MSVCPCISFPLLSASVCLSVFRSSSAAGFRHPKIGAHLSLHPVVGVAGCFPQDTLNRIAAGGTATTTAAAAAATTTTAAAATATATASTTTAAATTAATAATATDGASASASAGCGSVGDVSLDKRNNDTDNSSSASGGSRSRSGGECLSGGTRRRGDASTGLASGVSMGVVVRSNDLLERAFSVCEYQPNRSLALTVAAGAVVGAVRQFVPILIITTLLHKVTALCYSHQNKPLQYATLPCDFRIFPSPFVKYPFPLERTVPYHSLHQFS